ncbi:MAG: histidine kinase [Flavisolibacter sp.]|nr:histidine kinase [Flavisolibacter sp.]
MKAWIDSKMLAFYLWVSLAYVLLWTWHDMSSFNASFLQALLNATWRVVYIIGINFSFFEYAVPFLLRKKKYIVFNLVLALLFLWIYLLLWSFGLYVWRFLGVGLHIYTPLGQADDTGKLLETQMAFSMGSVFFFGISRHVYNHVRLRNTAQQLRIEKQEAELNYLRSQTNPHFLFNTLNNVYALARDKDDKAPESILRLSKLLRFMLYETGGDFISIEQELRIITDYIELEKLRYDESLRIQFTQDIENMKQALPPLLLIPLVENAFKHGVSETRSRPFIHIHLAVHNRQLKLVVRNSTEEASGQRPIKEHIGLSNLRRQLELLYKEYDLSLRQEPFTFTAILQINLASHV